MLKEDLRNWLEETGYTNDFLQITDTGFSVNGMQEVSFDKFDRYEYDLWSFSMVYENANAIIPNVERIKVELYGDWDLYIHFIIEVDENGMAREINAKHYRSHRNPAYENLD